MMKKRIANAAIGILIGLALLAPGGGWAAVEGQEAVPFVAQTLDGQVFDLSRHLRREVVVLNYWSVFCRDCIARVEAFNKMQERFQKRPFVLMGVCGDQLSSRMLEQVKKYAGLMRYSVILDPDLRVYELYKAEIFPYVVVIGRDGKVALVIKDLAPESLKKLSDTIDRLTQ